ncbi:hypothetical protein N7535_008737 [Penicillium sp. DV-2018c]|nr:hypothetical protein N7461_002494 [Penicillium sp. DV-2018c]KAJ5563573.1 hypothetical protein N7535_008737 [Penicillium sp. DV-2018c]
MTAKPILFQDQSEVSSPHTQASMPDDTKHQRLAKRVRNPVRRRPRINRKRSDNADSSETGESEYASTTEYRASDESYSSHGGDDSESSSSPQAKRGKRSAAKFDDYGPQPKTTNTKRIMRKLSESNLGPVGSEIPNEEDQSNSTDEDGDTIRRKRQARNRKFARERAQRLLQIGKLTPNDDLCPDEQRTAQQLATRGIMPTIYKHWQLDFPTVADPVFFSDEDKDLKLTEQNFVLQAYKGTEFDAITAFRDLLELCSRVKDCCNVMKTSPYHCIMRTIRRYLDWAMRDALIKVDRKTIPAHIIYCKRKNENAKSAIDHAAAELSGLAGKWRRQLGAFDKGVWPALIGIVVCGPVLYIVGLDANPRPHSKAPGVKFLGQIDLKSTDSDIWSTLGVAIVIKHIQMTMVKLATAYNHPSVAQILDESSFKALDDHDPDL